MPKNSAPQGATGLRDIAAGIGVEFDDWLLSPTPRRLQLRRVDGFNLQATSYSLNGLRAIHCARPGWAGNPFHTHGDGRRMSAETATRLFRAALLRDGFYYTEKGVIVWALDVRRKLRNANLACFCPLDSEWCHVDTLLEVANS